MKLPTIRAYLSNIVKTWPLDKQEAMHAAGTPGWPNGNKVAIYRDEVKPAARKAHSPEALRERAEALRPTSRRRSDELLHVASLAVLAWSPEDFMGCMAAAAARGATIVVLSTGRRILPTAGARELADAQKEFMEERRRAQTSPGRKEAAKVQGAKRRADTSQRIDLIRADWPLRTVATADLLLRAGRIPRGKRDVVPMAYSIAKRHLGPRPAAQEAHERALEREARRRELDQEGRSGKRKRRA